MKRVISLVAVTLLLVALFGLLATTATLAQEPVTPQPTSVPLKPMPTPSVGTEDQQAGGGILGGLKRTAENLWNLIFNKDKRGSSLLDILAMMLGGGNEGLEGLAEKFVSSDWFFPRFGEDGVGEDLAKNLVGDYLKLWLVALPLYYLTRLLGNRETLARFVLNWGLLAALLLADRLMWNLTSVFFLKLEGRVLQSTAVENLRVVVDAVAVTMQDSKSLVIPVILWNSVTVVLLLVAILRYTYTVIRMLAMRLLTPIRLIRDLGFNRPSGVWRWFGQVMATFIEISIFWTLVKIFLAILANNVPTGWVWMLLPAFAAAMLFIPAGFTEGLFAQVAQKILRGAGATEEEIVATRKRSSRQERTERAGTTKAAIREVLGTGAAAGLEALREHSDSVAMAQTMPPAGLAATEPQASGPQSGGQAMADVGGANPSGINQTTPAAQPSANQALKMALKVGLDTAKVEAIRKVLAAKGVEVGAETAAAGGKALAASLGSISAPAAVIAAAAVLALGVAAADAWIIGKTLSSHMNEYRHVGELSETIIEAEARRQATRRAAARYHRIKKEAE